MRNDVQSGNLYIWGKRYSKVTQLMKGVLQVAAGQNHIVYTTVGQQSYGVGSNKFGQLALKETIFYDHPQPIFKNHQIKSFYCGAEHTFFINDKQQVYSTGLNIKGQLGHSVFQNVNQAKIVPQLLPKGLANPLSSKKDLFSDDKPLIIEVLEKYDLQVKIQNDDEKKFLLQADEYVDSIACGALFTIALSNKGRIFGCGFQGQLGQSKQSQIERGKFKHIQVEQQFVKIRSGLSGSVGLTADHQVYLWGRFGRLNYNNPQLFSSKEVEKYKNNEYYIDAKVGDEFLVLLNQRGEVLTFGQNIDDQLGLPCQQVTFQDKPTKIMDLQSIRSIQVGRNTAFAISSQGNYVYGWGSNRYGQISLHSNFKLKCHVNKLGWCAQQKNHQIIASSYFTMILSNKSDLDMFNISVEKIKGKKEEETISFAEYRKLLGEYQVIKGLNLSLLEKSQPPKIATQAVQTNSVLDIDGIMDYRKFNSNIDIDWKQIQLESQINEGGYGVIYRAKWRQITVVCKKFKIDSGDVSLKDFLSECHAMEAVRHPFIVMFLGVLYVNYIGSQKQAKLYKGSLWSYLQNADNVISWEQRRRLLIEIAQGILYLHLCKPPIIHRDLKSLNIFLDAHLRIKIGDFGWTKALGQYMTNKIGTYQWMAPEVIGNQKYTEKADVFSYSIIMWQVASRQPPYKNIGGNKVAEDVMNKKLRPQIPKKTPEGYVKLMRRCWDSEPIKRPSFKQIIRELEIVKL